MGMHAILGAFWRQAVSNKPATVVVTLSFGALLIRRGCAGRRIREIPAADLRRRVRGGSCAGRLRWLDGRHARARRAPGRRRAAAAGRGQDGPGTASPAAAFRWPVRRDQGADRRVLHYRLRGPRRGDRGRREAPGGCLRHHRNPAIQLMNTDVKAVRAAVDGAFRDEWGRVVATLIRTTGDWDLAEECAQDAFAMALQRWPKDGIPGRPGAWLTTAARNRAIDVLRRKAVGAAKLREVAAMSYEPEPPTAGDSPVPDDRLRLMFTCCHPALALEARVALTLRTLAGLTTAEIARAFLASEPTMAKRLVRAKQKIQNAGIPYRVPPAHLLPERTPGVLAVLYLLFNEGYSATAGADLVRQNLCVEAIRLARVLTTLMPDEAEAGGLLALMLLHDARRAARLDAQGDLVTLEDQDRARWDKAEIAEGVAALEGAL